MAWDKYDTSDASFETSSGSFRFTSDEDSVSTASSECEDTLWKTTAKHWTPATWSMFDEFLLKNGYQLLASDFKPSCCYAEDRETFLAERKAVQLDDFHPYENLRKAYNMKGRVKEEVYVRALVANPDSDEVEAFKLLTSAKLREDTKNFVVKTHAILQTSHSDTIIYFFIQEDAGEPCFNFPFTDEILWRRFVLNCFEGLDLLHSLGIAHLDIGPMNVLYNEETRKPSFIDFEGCQIHPGFGQQEQNKQEIILCRPPLAVNARLPELGSQFQPFAADCWMLGDMLLQMKRFPGDDLTALFRFMCMTEPKARPTIRYALEKLRDILDSKTNGYY